jgi:hypothetical protein
MTIKSEGRKHIVEGQPKLSNPDIINIFIKLIGLDTYRAEYFLLRRKEVQDILVRNYRRWLDNHHGIRPKKPESTHPYNLPHPYCEEIPENSGMSKRFLAA